MTEMITIRTMQPSEAPEVHQFVMALFERYLFPDYSEKRKQGVHEMITQEYLKIADESSFTWVAEQDAKIIGMVKTKRGNHVSMLFVKERYWRAGIGEKLLNAAIKEIITRNEKTTCVTLNSSKFAMKFYRRMGFVPTAEESAQTPMQLLLETNKS